MPQRPTPLTDDLRDLIRILRTDVAKLSQRQAALAAGISTPWWHQIESGVADTVPADTVARMVYSLDGTPDQLRAIGEDHVADLVERRHDLLEPETAAPVTNAAEEHLWQTPGVSDDTRAALVTYLRTLHQVKTA